MPRGDSILTKLSNARAKAVSSFGAGHTLCFLALIVWLILCAVWVTTEDTPWEPKITERLIEGKKLKDEQHTAIALWWGSVINLAGAIWLILTFPWWGRRDEPRSEFRTGARNPLPVGLLGVLLLISILAAALWVPRLSHSFTNDEEMAFRKFVHGEWKPPGETFRAASWERTLIQNSGNNHTLQAAASRATQQIWKRLENKEAHEFSETALRLPSVVGGLGAVWVIGVLGYLLGGIRVGGCAALFLALSPWFLRYAVEARGYALLIFAMSCAMLFGIIAIERGNCRWWFAYGLLQACYLLCFQGAVYVAIAFNAGAAIAMLTGSRRSRRPGFSRFIAGNVFSVMIFGAFQTVSILQTLEKLNSSTFKLGGTNVSFAWVRDTVSHLVAGIPWNNPRPASHFGLSAQFGWDGQPFYLWVLILVFPLLALFGLISMSAHGWRARIVILPICAAVIGAAVHNAVEGNLLHGWYLIYAIIPFVLSLAWAAEHVAPVAWRKWLCFMVPVVGLYVLVVYEPIQVLQRYDRQPMRQLVSSIRGAGGYAGTLPSDAGIITATFSTSARQVLSYDPWVRLPRTREDLDAIIEEARTSQKELYVYFCGTERAKTEFAPLYERVVNASDFRKVREIKGLEYLFLYSVYRLK